MTALTVVQEAATEIGLSQPTAVFSSTDSNIITLRTMMNTMAKMMRDAGDWVELTKEHTFNTASSDADYNLPADYDHIVTQTAWNRTNYRKMRESIDGPLWQAIKSGILQSSVATDGFRIRGYGSGQFLVDPTPTATEALVYEYQTAYSVLSSGGTAKAAFTADTDTFILDEYYLSLGVVWRFNRSKGFAYEGQRQEWELGMQKKFGRDGGAPVIDMGGTLLGVDPLTPANVQEGNFPSV